MRKNLFWGVFAVFAFLLSTGTALALGTAAGTSIDNLATVYYNVAGIPQTEVDSDGGTPTTFEVDTKIDLLVDTLDLTAVTIAPSGTAYATYNVVNLGNATQDIGLTTIDPADGTANPLGAGVDNIDSSVAVVLYEETNATPGLQTGGGGDTIVTALDDVTPSTDGSDNARIVYQVITAASTVVQNDLAVYGLLGTAQTAAGGVLNEDAGADITVGSEVVFADGAGTDDVAEDKQHSDRSAFLVVTATLTITKSVAVFDTGGGLPTDTYAIPGAIVTYTINVANAAGGDTATAITVVDEIPTSTDFYVTSGPTGGDGSPTQYEYSNQTPFDPLAPTWTETPAADGNGVDTDVTAIKIRMSDIAAGNNASATFKVKIQ